MSHKRAFSLLMFVLGTIAAAALGNTSIWAQLLDIPIVTIGIDDYAAVPADGLARAQREVSRWYAAINVRTTWLDTRHLADEGFDGQEPARPAAPDLTIIVLSPQMADRKALPAEVVGCAPGTTTERGRIAYVLYGRLRSLAADRAGDEVDLLGIVIAHEVGHLLLPYGSHSETGIMRGHWELEELRHQDVQTLTFTPSQAELIRRRVAEGKSSD